MIEETNFSLKNHNTFGIDARAAIFVTVQTANELTAVFANPAYRDKQKLILGGGSNILFTSDFDGLVVKINIKGIEKIDEDDNYVWIKSGAGEVWHDLVLHCINNDWGGIENLSLIPGTVGAAPIQNIGAYGVELKDVFDRLEAFEIESGETKIFDHAACAFGYRNSVFKNALKGKYIITAVVLRLTKKHQINTSYGAIEETLAKHNATPSIKSISDAVCEIRSSKLPNPSEIGNAGSFFKNPEIPEDHFHALKEKYENIIGYPTDPGFIKVPAGWLIEQCGWKGKTIGNIGVHKNQALVLVNYGGGKGEEIKKLAFEVQKSVKDKFGIELTPEVNMV